MNKFASSRLNQIEQLQALEAINIKLQRKYASELITLDQNYNVGMTKHAGVKKFASERLDQIQKLQTLSAVNTQLQYKYANELQKFAARMDVILKSLRGIKGGDKVLKNLTKQFTKGTKVDKKGLNTALTDFLNNFKSKVDGRPLNLKNTHAAKSVASPNRPSVVKSQKTQSKYVNPDDASRTFSHPDSQYNHLSDSLRRARGREDKLNLSIQDLKGNLSAADKRILGLKGNLSVADKRILGLTDDLAGANMSADAKMRLAKKLTDQNRFLKDSLTGAEGHISSLINDLSGAERNISRLGFQRNLAAGLGLGGTGLGAYLADDQAEVDALLSRIDKMNNRGLWDRITNRQVA